MPVRRPPGTPGRLRGAPFLVSAAVALAVGGLFVAGFTLGTALGSLPRLEPPRSGEGAGRQQAGQGQAGVPGSLASTLDQTVLIFETAYQGCGCVVRESRVAGPEFAGMSQGELEAGFPGWQLQSFGAGEVLFFRTAPGLCPEMEKYRTIGLHEGFVAVFLGRPGGGLLLAQQTDIAAAQLSPADLQRLESGIVLEGDEAVERYLEGLTD